MHGWKKEGEISIFVINAEAGFAMPCTMPMCFTAWTAHPGRINPNSVLTAEPKLLLRISSAGDAEPNCSTGRWTLMGAEESRMTSLEHLRQTTMEHYGFGTNIMRHIRICPKCGMPSGAEEKNCGSCGTKLPRETLFQQYKKRHRFCSHCDTVVADDAQFCPECGARIQLIKPLKFFR